MSQRSEPLPSLRVGHFKAFRDLQEIPLRPLTLVYGPNSGGKSSILQALLLISHIIRGGAIDTACVDAAPGAVDLGGLRHFSYASDLSQPATLEIDLNPGIWSGLKQPRAEEGAVTDISDMPASGGELLIGGSDLLSCRFELRCGFSLAINGKPLVEFGVALQSERPWEPPVSSPFPDEAPLPVKSHPFSHESDEFSCQAGDVEMKHECVHRWIAGRFAKRMGAELQPELWLDACSAVREHFWTRAWMKGIMPEVVSFDNAFDPAHPENSPYEHNESLSDETRLIFALFEEYIFRLTQAVRLRVAELLGSPFYHGPLRSIVGRKVLNLSPATERGEQRENFAFTALASDPNLLNEVNRWMEKKLGLATSYNLVVRRFFESEKMRREFNRRLKEITEHALPWHARSAVVELLEQTGALMEVTLKDKRTGVYLNQRDVGVGISQMLPILIAALGARQAWHIIEQPELHLHPAIQAELADLFIESALGERQNHFIIETHSEHLLLRIMRRIREQALATADSKAVEITAGDVSVVYVEPTEQGSVIRLMKLNDRGELVNDWPGGFFEEGLRELLI